MFRQFFFSLTLAVHAVVALLGHAGLHEVVGHYHADTNEQGSARNNASHVCAHGHAHHGDVAHSHSGQPDDDQPDDDQRGQEPDGDHDHSDCVVCQFTAQAQSPLCFVDLPALNEFPEAAFIVAEQLFIAAAESAFDSRGPPLACTC